MMSAFAELKVGGGLRGVTKVAWREWPKRTWLSWTLAGIYIAAAVFTCYLLAPSADELPTWVNTARLIGAGVLVLMVAIRLLMEATVSKPLPGEVPAGDRKLMDPWWSTIHTSAGVVLGLWLISFVIAAILTILWELVEISVPGFGDEEINGNRMFDILLAWTGWFVAASIVAVGAGVSLPLI